MEVKCTLEEKVSKKTGNPYTVLLVHLTDNCVKQVFLDQAEIELLKMKSNNSSDYNPFEPFE